MRFDDILENAQDFVSSVPPAVKGGAETARKNAYQAADVISHRADDAREVVADKAGEVQKFTMAHLVRAYDLASRFLPMVFPERAAKVRNRRIAYAAVGSLLLGAGAVAVVELRRPGTLAKLGKRIQRLGGKAVDEVETELGHAKDAVTSAASDVKSTMKQATTSAANALEDVKEKAATGVDAMKEKAATGVDAMKERVSHLGAKAEEGAKEVKAEARKDFEQAKDKISQAIDIEAGKNRTYANGNRHS